MKKSNKYFIKKLSAIFGKHHDTNYGLKQTRYTEVSQREIRCFKSQKLIVKNLSNKMKNNKTKKRNQDV